MGLRLDTRARSMELSGPKGRGPVSPPSGVVGRCFAGAEMARRGGAAILAGLPLSCRRGRSSVLPWGQALFADRFILQTNGLCAHQDEGQTRYTPRGETPRSARFRLCAESTCSSPIAPVPCSASYGDKHPIRPAAMPLFPLSINRISVPVPVSAYPRLGTISACACPRARPGFRCGFAALNDPGHMCARTCKAQRGARAIRGFRRAGALEPAVRKARPRVESKLRVEP